MKWASLFMLCVATRAGAQDSTYSELRFRLSAFRNPVAGHITDDWKPGTGAQVEVATPIAQGELSLAVGHVGYTATTGRPDFTGTLFTLAWTTRVAHIARLQMSGGVRLTDFRMDFDDPSLVVGLRTEEEVMLGLIGRGRIVIGRRFALFGDGSVGVLMLGTRTPMVLIHAGVERAVSTPGWLRGILR